MISVAGTPSVTVAERSVVTVDISEFANNTALTTEQTLQYGALNVWGNSLPWDTLRNASTEADIPFEVLPADGQRPDNMRCAGQYVPLPELRADWLHLLATSERRCEEEVHVHYSDGAVDAEWFRVSDFWPAAAHFGERLAARSTRMHYPNHRQFDLVGQIWGVRVPTPRREPLAGVRLPDNPALHVFALSVESIR
jgi:hypothetical protein